MTYDQFLKSKEVRIPHLKPGTEIKGATLSCFSALPVFKSKRTESCDDLDIKTHNDSIRPKGSPRINQGVYSSSGLLSSTQRSEGGSGWKSQREFICKKKPKEEHPAIRQMKKQRAHSKIRSPKSIHSYAKHFSDFLAKKKQEEANK